MEQFIHPEGKIVLLNGNVIDTFERKEKKEFPPFDWMQFDTSGQYFRIGRHRSKKKEAGPDEKTERHREMFRRNAIALYHNKERIFADSRMFLTPIDMGCNMAYFGKSGLNGATLGVWLELWDTLEQCRTDEKGNERLITFFCGSPLSGVNHCTGIRPSGKKEDITILPFRDLWGTFVGINRRYYDLSQKYQAYSLEETLRKLHIPYRDAR